MKSVLVSIPAKRDLCESHSGAETMAVIDKSALIRLGRSSDAGGRGDKPRGHAPF